MHVHIYSHKHTCKQTCTHLYANRHIHIDPFIYAYPDKHKHIKRQRKTKKITK